MKRTARRGAAAGRESFGMIIGGGVMNKYICGTDVKAVSMSFRV